MKKSLLIAQILLIHFFPSFSQDVVLFQMQDPLQIRVTGSVKSIKKNSNDSTLVHRSFEYQENGQWITVPVKARVRGNFRLRNCYFPPLKLKFGKKDAASTVFAGNKSLKLVLPCEVNAGKNDLIRKEYICYQFYQALSPYYFRTRLANMELTEISRKNPRNFDLLTFFVEDNSMVAERSGGTVTELKGISPAAFDEKQSVRNDFFQYMIGNADWSSVYQHNSNTLFVNGKYIPLSYDFDMSGFVNAGYAQANPPNLGTGDVRERVYRGFCRSAQAMQEIRDEFLAKEGKILSIINEHEAHFNSYQAKDMNMYIEGFFDILKNDSSFKASILEQCRTEK